MDHFSRFLLVGALVTLLDFGAFNLLAATGLHRIASNIFSTSLALGASFLFNFHWAFFRPENAIGFSLATFLPITLFSAFVLQNLVLLLARRRLARGLLRFQTLRSWNPEKLELLDRNLAKSLAISLGLTWNFLWYEFYVFA